METFMKRQGYKYYVYIAPGNISYFETFEVAKEYADLNNASVQGNF